jgi:hyperosmotically inducible protein
MKNSVVSLVIAVAALAGFATTGPAFAQTAGQSFHQAGESTENAGSSTGNAIGHAWHGTVTAVKDTDITSKVKLGLHDDVVTKDKGIRVDTDAGIVTLTGDVKNERIADRAQQIAERTTGVKDVRNHIYVESHHQPDRNE